jgi:alpha-galactosidase/6-phospho-beta-glucosidase family protein
MANPLSSDYRVAVPLLDALLEGNREHLPRFFRLTGDLAHPA